MSVESSGSSIFGIHHNSCHRQRCTGVCYYAWTRFVRTVHPVFVLSSSLVRNGVAYFLSKNAITRPNDFLTRVTAVVSNRFTAPGCP